MVKWTSKQREAIDVVGKNLLVSAAAGSGKTAVLVERIIQMIMDQDNPVDIDRIVVVTFTNAAAAQMKEKIFNRVVAALDKEPDNVRLQKTLPLVHKASIMTIDSFCLDIVRNNFNCVDIAPGFRVGDIGELELMKSDALAQIFEENYAARKPGFIRLMQSIGYKKNDDNVKKLISDIDDMADSFPWPELWLDSCVDTYNITMVEELLRQPFMEFVMTEIRETVEKHSSFIKECVMEIVPDGKKKETQTLLEAYKNLKYICEVLEQGDYRAFYQKTNIKIVLPSGSGAENNSKYRKPLSGIRDDFQSLRNKYYSKSVEQIIQEFQRNKELIQAMIDLVKEYRNRFSQMKRLKNIIDFSDMEHMALDILVKNENGILKYTKEAEELSDVYQEIFVDEYQDSNEVQEYILNAISRTRKDNYANNMFMVGDVKQSIYQFRMARPEIFMQKYNSYPEYVEGVESENVKVELRQNFRSREHVLASVNDIFMNIMKAPVGNVEYNESVKLNYGREAEGFEYNFRFATDVCVIDSKSDSEKENDETTENGLNEEDSMQEFSAAQIEATVIADKIIGMMEDESFLLKDDDSGEYRRARYSDFVILMRAGKVWADAVVEILQDRGIPAQYNSETGYFDSREIKGVLNYLSIIDNPRQDIALFGSMVSYFGRFTETEVALIKMFANANEKVSLYDALVKYISDGGDPELREKCQSFHNTLQKFRKMVTYTSVSELIWELVYESGYYDYMVYLGNERVRRTNLEILVQKAKNYEKISFVGLFNFLRYIQKLRKYDVDYGSASVSGNEEVVNVMTIHKSKGLEFPVVFVAGMGKRINKKASQGDVLRDPDYKLGIDDIRLDKRIKRNTFYKNVMKDKINCDIIGEELRVLYVAFTRAKEKLVLVGHFNDFEKRYGEGTDADVNYRRSELIKVNNYFDMILPSVIKNSCNYFNLEKISNVKAEETVEITLKDISETDFREYRYQYEVDTTIPSKFSVSDIKHESMITPFEINEQAEIPIPSFMSGKKSGTISFGATKGNAYHKVMELLDYSKVLKLSDIEMQIEHMNVDNKELIESRRVYNFCDSEIGRRIAKANKEGMLFREQQFVFGIKAKELNREYQSDEMVMIQGIIDMFWIEEDGVVLLDYKTDKIYNRENGAVELIKKYESQLRQYQYAISKITGLKVKDCYIYSFELEEFVTIGL